MDGGRILRSSLAIIFGHARATKTAVFVGRLMALVFVAAAIYFRQTTFGIVGAFVFMAAGLESQTAAAGDVSESRYDEPDEPFQ